MGDLRLVKIKSNDVSKWNCVNFSLYIKKKHEKKYGCSGNEFLMPIFQIAGKLKNTLMKKFIMLGKNKLDMKAYVDWFFEIKAEKYTEPFEIYVLASERFIFEWMKQQQDGKKTIGTTGGYSGLKIF